MNDQEKRCQLCGRSCDLTFHHLIPKKLHRRKFFKKNYTKAILASGIDICRLCHNGIHDLYDEMTLGKRFNTLDALRNDENIAKHIMWVKRQKV